jgi:hypothetical protein
MRAILCILATLIFITGCTPKKPRPLTRCGYNADSEEITNVIISYSRELKDSHRLFLHDSRVIFDDKIKKVRVDYTSQQSVELCEAREILVDVTEGLIDRFRNHVELRSAFNNRPISPQDLEIHITFESFFNKYVDPAYMAYIILENSWSFFYSSELNMAFTDIWMQKVEPYYKTKQFVTFSREAEIPYIDAGADDEKESALEDERLYFFGPQSSSLIRN